MCKILKISRSGYYNYNEPINSKDKHTELIVQIFNQDYQAYGTRRIEAVLKSKKINLSRRRIAGVMASEGLVSTYTVRKFKPEKDMVNKNPINNEVDRNFNNREKHEVIVSDLTYVKVGTKWCYVCTIVDLSNREIIASSSGPKKNASLVIKAFAQIKINLNNIQYFHTDRGKEFDNKLIDDVLKLFNIKRSLSKPGSPYDNAVAEATFKSMKTEFIYPRNFENMIQLENQLNAYVWWYNNERLHSSLNYKAPRQWIQQTI